MKKKILTLVTILTITFGAFGAGVYAHEKGWLSFTGDAIIKQSESDVDRIMEILRQVNEDKLTAEAGLKEIEKELEALEGTKPNGLVKQIKELKAEKKELENKVSHLEAELTRANTKVEGLGSKTSEALEEAEGYLQE